MKSQFIILALCLLSFSGQSLTPPSNGEDARPFRGGKSSEMSSEDRAAFKQKIRSQKIAFFTEKLALTSEEAEKFWPIYNAYFDAREKLQYRFLEETRCTDCGCVKVHECAFDISKLSDDEIKKLVDDKAKIIDLEKKFHADLSKVFTPRKILTFYNTEHEFQRELIHKLDKSRGADKQPAKKSVKKAPQSNVPKPSEVSE